MVGLATRLRLRVLRTFLSLAKYFANPLLPFSPY
nr:MAG TPA: hypothetical protein [Caudoviricetes sp.]